jgi:hypothetical protein
MKKYKNDGSVKYKYTKNMNRDMWLREMYPLANMILSKVVSKIPWKNYRFEGSTLCQFSMFDEDDNESVEIKNIRGQAEFSEDFFPYSIIGGTACELYGKMFPEIGDIYEIVDATADIDIVINLPLFTPEIEIEIETLVTNIGDSYTELNNHFTNWLFDEIVKLFKKIIKYFEKSQFSLPNVNSDYELSRADLSMIVGPLLVTRVLLSEQNMIKIQVSTQVNNEISDHFIEFILKIPKTSDNYYLKESHVIFDSLIVQHPLKLFEKQIDALINRQDIEIDEDKHKFYNHCARVIYLSELLIFLRKNNMIDRQSPDNITIFNRKNIDLNKLCKHVFKNYDRYNKMIGIDRESKKTKGFKPIFENYDLHDKILTTLKILSSRNLNKDKMNKSGVSFKK